MLIANCLRNNVGNLCEGSALALLPGQWNSYRQFEKFIMPEMATAVLQGAADPPGGYIPSAYRPPIVVGEMAMRSDSLGTLTGDLIPSLSMSMDMTGSGTLEATAALAIAMAMAMSGSGTFAATIEGRLNMSMDMTGTGDLDASLSGIGNMAIAMLGTGDLEATIAAYGNMELDIVVTGTGLSVANVGQAVWSAIASANNEPGTMGEKLNDAGSAANPWTETLPGAYVAGSAGYILGNQLSNILAGIGTRLVESGMSQDEVTRIMLAALSGTTSGLGTSQEVYHSVDGTIDRLTVDFDANSNRTAVVMDGS